MLTICVVDPVDRNRKNLDRIFKSFGAPFKGFETGEAYLASALFRAPHTVVISINQNDIDGFDLLKLAIEQGNASAVFAVLSEPSVAKAVRAIKLGCEDVFERPVSIEPIIRAARLGSTFGKSASPINGADIPTSKPLSKREREVLDFLLAGKTCRHIANTLKISVRTAEAHRRNIFQKTGVHSQVDLVRKLHC